MKDIPQKEKNYEKVMASYTQGYKEYDPPANLQRILDCYWSYRVESTNIVLKQNPIIPDGCIDIIFDLNSPATLNSFIIGAMTKPIINNKTNLIGVRFKPGMAYYYLNCPLHEMTDLVVEYSEFTGREANEIVSQLLDQQSTQSQISLLNSIVIKKLSTIGIVEKRMSQALHLIQKTNGRCSINQISNEVGWSRQHFTRKCLQHTGLSPKFFCQVIRVNQLIKRYKIEKIHDWSRLSFDVGYYDQSHMINEFKKITGRTPSEFLG